MCLKSQNTQDRFQLTKKMALRLCSVFNAEDNSKIYIKLPIKSLEGSYKNRLMHFFGQRFAIGTNKLKRSGIEIKEA
jgi:hypothetical protein